MKSLLIALFALALVPPAFADNGFLMGTSTVDVTPPIGVPLAGWGGTDRRIIPFDVFGKYKYAHFFKPSTGVLDPIRSKALVLSASGQKVLFVSLDVVGVEAEFVYEVKAYAASLGIQSTVVSATHTHSGPGALGRNGFFAVVATDRFEPKIYKGFLNGVKQSITEAVALLEPITLYRTDFDATGFSRNRRNHDDIETTAHLLYGKNARNEIVGGFVNFAVHSTVLGGSNMKFSADFAGGIERNVTRRLGAKHTILFMNGAEGDISHTVQDYADIDVKGAEFAEHAAAALPASVEVAPTIHVRTGQFKMPRGQVHLSKCAKLPNPLNKIVIHSKKFFPESFELMQLEIGDIFMATWPGEPTAELGLMVGKAASEVGYQRSWNLGLSNGYMGYFLTEADYAQGHYEVCSALHGPKAGQTLVESHEALLKF